MIPIFTEPSIKQLLTGYDKKIPGDFSLYSWKAREQNRPLGYDQMLVTDSQVLLPQPITCIFYIIKQNVDYKGRD